MSYPTLSFPSTAGDAVTSDAGRLGFSRAPNVLPDMDLTLTPALVLNGSSDGSGLTGTRTLTTPTAAELVAALPGALVGTSVEHTFVAAGGYDIVLAVGAGVTLLGGDTVTADTSGKFRVRLTNVTSGAEAAQLQRLL